MQSSINMLMFFISLFTDIQKALAENSVLHNADSLISISD